MTPSALARRLKELDPPRSPGIYRFVSETGVVLYVGKAKNLKRRLGQYGQARKHVKMKKIIKSAANVVFETTPTELDALLLENHWIQNYRPKWNLAGAFSFLYPMIALPHAFTEANAEFVYTSRAEFWENEGGFRHRSWHGVYRSREITGEAFFALMRLLGHVGHREKISAVDQQKSVYRFRFRQLGTLDSDQWNAFFKGESLRALSALCERLLESPSARRNAAETQDDLHALKRFYRHEAQRLKRAREKAAETRYPITQNERDALFIRAANPDAARGTELGNHSRVLLR